MSEFNKQAADYVKYRPVYPREVYDFLATLTPGHDLAYDAGTGNGQCATALADVPLFCLINTALTSSSLP